MEAKRLFSSSTRPSRAWSFCWTSVLIRSISSSFSLKAESADLDISSSSLLLKLKFPEFCNINWSCWCCGFCSACCIFNFFSRFFERKRSCLFVGCMNELWTPFPFLSWAAHFSFLFVFFIICSSPSSNSDPWITSGKRPFWGQKLKIYPFLLNI